MGPEGRVVIVDHDSVDGAGNSLAVSRSDGIHRLEDAYVEQIMTEAGFELVESSDALRIAEDDHTQPFFAEEMRGKPTDRFFHIYSRYLSKRGKGFRKWRCSLIASKSLISLVCAQD